MQTNDWTAIAAAVGVLEKPASPAPRHRIPLECVSPSAARVRDAQDETDQPLWKSICEALLIVVTIWVWTVLVWVMGGEA